MTTITETGHNLAGIQQALLDERERLDNELAEEIAANDLARQHQLILQQHLAAAHLVRADNIRAHIAAIDALIGSDEAEERKAA